MGQRGPGDDGAVEDLPPHVVAVGGLPYHTQGVQLLTNDPALARYVTARGFLRRFVIEVRGRIPRHLLDSISRGGHIDGEQLPGLDFRVAHEGRTKTFLELNLFHDDVCPPPGVP